MKSLLRSLALVLPMTLPLAGCSDILDLGSSNLLAGPYHYVVIEARFENAGGLATIENLRVTWDGDTLQDLVPSAPVAEVSVRGIRAGGEKGGHRLSFQILRQTSSPNDYRITGLGITSYGEQGRGRTLELEPRTALLETNGVITYTFRIE
ncbi:MAG: hypothetical protein M3547_00445 [Acidobacteriota bacterium]|nr:hypothetical protein [Acidobacteriota bacterium]